MALITVMVITAILVVIGVTVSMIGNNEAVLSGIYEDGEMAFSIADACAEEGLMRLKADQSFTGTSFALDGGFCSVAVQNISGNTYLVAAEGEFANNTRVIIVNATVHFNAQGNARTALINSWREAE